LAVASRLDPNRPGVRAR
jgi:molybdate transport system substrate-binding protein